MRIFEKVTVIDPWTCLSRVKDLDDGSIVNDNIETCNVCFDPGIIGVFINNKCNKCRIVRPKDPEKRKQLQSTPKEIVPEFTILPAAPIKKGRWSNSERKLAYDLFYNEKLSYAQIANVLNRKVGAVIKSIHVYKKQGRNPLPGVK